ncbi:hypothetical protein TrLO_g7190 [Triparma laevis f. longispina]|uniref:Uncharacterized protein n=1 Tax=Triparma laevis f. longispina TaxID=1714387 RepID=A0A9W7AUA8_9STRA|nr:hypothetical protein TrLO_g7190 [Triparma laevis f. longispina]
MPQRLNFLTLALLLIAFSSLTAYTVPTSRRSMIRKVVGSAGVVSGLVVGGQAGQANTGYTEAMVAEPTEEFKRSEAQRAEFRAAQLKEKAEFTKVLSRLETSSRTEETLVKDLDDLTTLTIKFGGLPEGIKADALKKAIRAVKREGTDKFWSTPVEVGYQKLTREIAFQQNPNKDKELGNPIQ